MKPLLIAGVLLLSGCSHLMPAAKPQTLHYQCGTLPLTVMLNPDPQGGSATFLLDGESHTLPRVPAGYGTRYSDDRYAFWRNGNQAFIARGDRIIVNDCVLK
ncbi:lysozyme inhibitor [Dickeya sp. CFBP 2040]|uniref:Lysozyme inhibitor n=1 Tax=Dickeya poaceiphila TaxID=568768 RepID=A0A5B8HKW6_9GAMM|nr:MULTISPECIES: MliC family protein [Dickeya]NKI73792.1 lysozyme inhibitor [Dickeya sp. CFBP 2040]QDX29796.1 lysozyme inhibitor [Dickeya poaceiphila]